MPVKSKAQLRWLHHAESAGELPKGTARRWLKHTPEPVKSLPEHVKKEALDSVAENLLAPKWIGLPDGSILKLSAAVYPIPQPVQGPTPLPTGPGVAPTSSTVPGGPQLPMTPLGTGLDAGPATTQAAAMPGIPGHAATNTIDRLGGLDPRGITVDGNNAAGVAKSAEILIAPMVKPAKDLLPGGLADRIPTSRFPAKALRQGQKVEKEHTESPALAKEIAKDHLAEDTHYYEKLEKMEGKSAEILIAPMVKAAFGRGIAKLVPKLFSRASTAVPSLARGSRDAVAAVSNRPVALNYPVARPGTLPAGTTLPTARALDYPVAQPYVSLGDRVLDRVGDGAARVGAFIGTHPKKLLAATAGATGAGYWNAQEPATRGASGPYLPPPAQFVGGVGASPPTPPTPRSVDDIVPGETLGQYLPRLVERYRDPTVGLDYMPEPYSRLLANVPVSKVVAAINAGSEDTLSLPVSVSNAMLRLGSEADERAAIYDAYNAALSQLPPEEQAPFLAPERSRQGYVEQGPLYGQTAETVRDPVVLARILQGAYRPPELDRAGVERVLDEYRSMQAAPRHLAPAQAAAYQQMSRAARLQLARALENREAAANAPGYNPRDVADLLATATAGGDTAQRFYAALVDSLNPAARPPAVLRNKTPWQPRATSPGSAFQRSLAARGLGDLIPGSVPVGGYAHPGPELRHSYESLLQGPQDVEYDEATGEYRLRQPGR